jgi:hypothetical protein
MQKKYLFMFLPLLVLVLASTSYGWQGRMGGMGDPYGLIADESDFLIHPAKISGGEGVRFYGNYRFSYTGVSAWDHDIDRFDATGTLTDYYSFDTSGQAYSHDAQLGGAFPLGPGRMGIFFTYDGMRGNYDGDEVEWFTAGYDYYDYNLTSAIDDFTLRFLYGLPVAGMDVGLELGMAYSNEEQKTWLNNIDLTGTGTQNYMWGYRPYHSLFPFMIPYDSDYWELMWKVGMGKVFDSLGIDWTVRGGYIIFSDNRYEYRYGSPAGFASYNADMDGDVDGWRIGSDLWFKYAAGDGLTLPFLISIDYAEKNRDGDGIGIGPSDTGELYDYEHNEREFDIKVGGGVEKDFGGNALIGVGLYYNYLQRNDAIWCYRLQPGGGFRDTENDPFPLHQEHMAIVRLTGATDISPAVTLRMGLGFFYGWVTEDFEFSMNEPFSDLFSDDISLNGHHWGVGISLGGTVRLQRVTLEPFINAGYQEINLNGDGSRVGVEGGVRVNDRWDINKARREVFVGGGVSVLFDVP